MLKGYGKDTVELEFAMYQTSDFVIDEQIDKTWADIGEMKHDETQGYIFKNLSQVKLGILCIPHLTLSVKECLYVCAKTRHSRGHSRGRPWGSQTLSSLMVCKFRQGECYNKNYTTDELETLRSGYKSSLQKQ